MKRKHMLQWQLTLQILKNIKKEKKKGYSEQSYLYTKENPGPNFATACGWQGWTLGDPGATLPTLVLSSTDITE